MQRKGVSSGIIGSQNKTSIFHHFLSALATISCKIKSGRAIIGNNNPCSPKGSTSRSSSTSWGRRSRPTRKSTCISSHRPAFPSRCAGISRISIKIIAFSQRRNRYFTISQSWLLIFSGIRSEGSRCRCAPGHCNLCSRICSLMRCYAKGLRRIGKQPWP